MRLLASWRWRRKWSSERAGFRTASCEGGEVDCEAQRHVRETLTCLRTTTRQVAAGVRSCWDAFHRCLASWEGTPMSR